MSKEEIFNKPQQIIKSLQIVELLKRLQKEVNQLDVEQKQNYSLKSDNNVNTILDEFIEQCFEGSSEEFNSYHSSYLNNSVSDKYITKRGNSCLIQNGLKIFKCQKCQKAFESPQKLGYHASKIHSTHQKIKKTINKF